MMVLLPLPVAPSSATVWPGSALEADFVQHRLAAAEVAERHVVEGHPALRLAAASTASGLSATSLWASRISKMRLRRGRWPATSG